MQSKTLIVLIAIATLGIGSPAMARGVAMHAGGSSALHPSLPAKSVLIWRLGLGRLGTLWRGKHHCCGFPAGDSSGGRGDWLNYHHAVSLE